MLWTGSMGVIDGDLSLCQVARKSGQACHERRILSQMPRDVLYGHSQTAAPRRFYFAPDSAWQSKGNCCTPNSAILSGESNLIEQHTAKTGTYDHSHRKIRDPVRSPIDKPVSGRLVVGSVTTSEYRLLYVYFFLQLFWPRRQKRSDVEDNSSRGGRV